MTVKYSSPFRYDGNLFWLILCLICLLPVGILLFLRNGYFVKDNSRFSFNYHGCWGWLYFWGIVFFPVAVLLIIFKGCDIIENGTRTD